ncbi:unnamed protein product [Peniophora sp. CBMAI 1063]|nr:unnamed protein product [Peniophora sp. CBMAI 1063]
MSSVTASSQHTYEVSLSGSFQPKDLQAILHRVALHSESSEPILLRARREMLEPDSPWVLYSYLTPESVRVHPEATVRPWAVVDVIGDALGFASVLGYRRTSQLYKKGYVFRRGSLLIQIFQHEMADLKTQKPIPAHSEATWEVEVRTAAPIRNTPDAPLSRTIDTVLEVQLLMKGLLDLRREDA